MEPTRLFDIPPHMLKSYPKPDALASKVDGVWTKLSTQEFNRLIQQASRALLKMGLKKGDCVATISNNRYEWNIMDQGMLQIGVVHVPLYPTISSNDYKFILNDCAARLVIVSDAEILAKVEAVRSEVPSIMGIYSYDVLPHCPHWLELLDQGKDESLQPEVERISKGIESDHLATLIYTSGTTGVPKGVMLSHRNIISNCIASEPLVPVDYTGTALSFLPLCHIYERMLTYLYQYLGISVYYAESMDKIADNIREVKPHIFATVPRLLEKVYDRIVAKGHEQTGIKRTLFFWALNLGLKYEHYGRNGWWYELQLKIANRLVFSKWREALGGRLMVVASGSAPLQPRLARVFWAAGIPVLEGYGLTETSPVVSVNTLLPNSARFGTVGKLIEGVSVRIAEDGEILCKGPNVMMGYYKRPDLTDSVMTDGWFHTGDIGEVDSDGFLKITDRKKEIFKTSGGKYVAPQPLENKMKESPFIEQIMVVGDGRKFPGALIVPAFAYCRSYLSGKGIDLAKPEEIAAHPEIRKAIQEEVKRINQNFGHTEQIKKFALLSREFSIAADEMTPTLKFKRKNIVAKYAADIESIYAGS